MSKTAPAVTGHDWSTLLKREPDEEAEPFSLVFDADSSGANGVEDETSCVRALSTVAPSSALLLMKDAPSRMSAVAASGSRAAPVEDEAKRDSIRAFKSSCSSVRSFEI